MCPKKTLTVAFNIAMLALAQAQTPEPAPTSEIVQLDPFVVSTSSNEGYLAKQAMASGRIAQKLEDVPQTIVVVNEALIADIAPSNAMDILNHVGGTSGSNAERYGSSVYVRGFDSGVALRNGFTQGPNNFAGFTGAVENFEQVEVVKGAAGVLYGQSQPGGLVNYVMKNPLFRPQTNLTLGTWFLHNTGGARASLDVTGPVGADTRWFKDSNGQPTLAYRAIMSYDDKRDYHVGRDRYTGKDFFGKLTWRPFPGFVMQGEFEYYNLFGVDPGRLYIPTTEIGKNPHAVRMPSAFVPVDYQQNPDGVSGENFSYNRFAQWSTRYTRDFGQWGRWTARAAYSWNNYYEQRSRTVSTQPRPARQSDLGSVINFNSTVTQADITAGRLLVPSRSVVYTLFEPDDNTRTQWDLTGQLETGPVSHTVLVGAELDLGARNSKVPYGGHYPNLTAFGPVAANGMNQLAIWLDNPSHQAINVNWYDIQSAANPGGAIVATPNFNAASIIGSPSGRKLSFDIPVLTRKPDAYYFFDNIGLFKERLLLTAGYRRDTVRQYVDNFSALFDQGTWRYGFVAKVKNWLHIYGVHSESFIANSANVSAAFGYAVPPQEGEQNEVGVRLFSPDKRLSLQVAAYDIQTRNNVVTNPFAPVGAPPATLYTFIDGVNNRGFDVDLTYSLNASTQVIASFAHYDATSTPTPAQLASTPGLTEVPLTNAAPNQFKLWARYALPTRLNSFVTLGYRWTDERPGGINGALPIYYIPSYAIVDTGFGCELYGWRLHLALRNVFDKYAFRTSVNAFALWPESPRTATFTASRRF